MKKKRLRALLAPIRPLAGFIVVWVLLYALGRTLASASAVFHKDKLWRDTAEEDAE